MVGFPKTIRLTSGNDSCRSTTPPGRSHAVWALPRSLAATEGIVLTFFSSGYLDVSLHRVPFVQLWIHCTMTELHSAGFPHSDICGSTLACSSPQLFAAYHVLLRRLVPRHPPCALCSLIFALFSKTNRLYLRLSTSIVVHASFDHAIASLILPCFSLVFFLEHYAVARVLIQGSASAMQMRNGGLKWTRTTDLTLIRRAL